MKKAILTLFLVTIQLSFVQAQDTHHPLNLRLSYESLQNVLDQNPSISVHQIFDLNGMGPGVRHALTRAVEAYEEPVEVDLKLHPIVNGLIDSVSATIKQNYFGNPGIMLGFSITPSLRETLSFAKPGEPIYEKGCLCIPSFTHSMILNRAITPEGLRKFGRVGVVYIDKNLTIRRIKFVRAFWTRNEGETSATVIVKDGKVHNVVMAI